MKIMADTKLREIRESINATQEQIVRRTRSLSVRTYVRAEDGQRVTYGTAKQILDAVNSLLVESGKPTIGIDDLGLNLY
jgi:transcriptional regulator with XRE-family HTH domain